MRDRLKALRRRVMQVGTGRGRRYPAKLRAEVMVVVADAREDGWSWDDLGAELDISAETLAKQQHVS